ncbi:MarR family winged helix-turn-helix transcriptional regulator [Clostridium sp. MT-14]|jgi:DNA-binding MarR family transcriptional regulator|uniref:MarR family winged helix-turn-helix transcriptional regulator n=1 Tax=Clostridium aromativorans TaxID=2836848 RepID=A0ABS8N6I4_9CLOT|nr:MULTISPECIES: MarR family winged helix-turn-helix transcriptional regulator [Clostridium]KAA8676044.1 winged helix-turn-helix transcriptional regulator [Clostridium sp. HV4-5-A1G]MCC9295402.1 MarR family winged helix-turn-helix transcriptional regulator [Clostridium aromativorans]CAB1247299.1 Putative HTH-type transcriptional regulator YusO [Clostridiaceae bacterium BL-3]
MTYEELQELHELLFKTMGLFHEKFLRQFPKESRKYQGIKKNHIMIIGFLYQNHVLTATQIAKMLNMEKGSLTTLIDQLEKSGLVIRCDDANDRRKTLISLTNDGKLEIEDIMKNSIQCMGKILGNTEPSELMKFVDSLKYAVEFMQKIKKVN